MIYAKFEQDGGSKVLVWEVTETLEELLKEIRLEESLMEYRKLKSEKRQKEFLGARVALKSLLGREVYVNYYEDGKPFLIDNCFNISISHSGKWIAVMAHPDHVVGIDIECIGSKMQRLYTRFLSEEEQLNLSNGENLQQLHLAWSAKEAAYKIIGKDAVDFPNQLYIEPFEVKEKGRIITIHTTSGRKLCFYYYVTEQFVLVYGMA